LWQAIARVPIEDGRKVRITGVEGLTLTVEPDEEPAA
jgi:membrane-bound ClpP family serine protease